MSRAATLRACVAACALLMYTSLAAADGPGIYLGGSGGISDLDIRSSNLARGNVSDVDDSSAGWKVFLGLMAPFDNGSVRANFGLEFSYVDLGEAEATVTPLAPAARSKFTADFEAYGISGIIGFRIWEGLSVFGKLGWFFGETDYNAGIAFTDFDHDNGDDGIHYGAGLSYAVTEHLDLRLDWDRYDIFYLRVFGTGEDSNPDFFSAGFQYRF